MPPRVKSSKRAADFDSDDEVATSKKTKATSFTTTSNGAQVDAEGNAYWEISKNRRVAISEFKGKQLIMIREYYEKNDEMLPGKKGISLTPEQFSALIEVLPQLETALQDKGISVTRPKYTSEPASKADSIDENEEAENETKKNHEATSEDDD
ncbi:hypothetical protein MBLNU457_7511t2 [Dothideomycetes sp. NU457]